MQQRGKVIGQSPQPKILSDIKPALNEDEEEEGQEGIKCESVQLVQSSSSLIIH